MEKKISKFQNFEAKICPSSPTVHSEISGNLRPSRSELEIRTETHANVFIGKIIFFVYCPFL